MKDNDFGWMKSTLPEGEVDMDEGSWEVVESPRCSQELVSYFPHDPIVEAHKGYFYGHTFMDGNYPAVTNSLKAYYTEMYYSKNDCLLQAQPVAFAAQWIKGQCYFNSATLLGGAKKHDWIKVLGYEESIDGPYMKYSVHNNINCKNKNKFTKSLEKKIYFPASDRYGECVHDGASGNWLRNTAYN